MAYRGNVAALLGDLPDAERRLAAAAAASGVEAPRQGRRPELAGRRPQAA